LRGFGGNADIGKLAIGLLLAGQSMIFSLAINVSPPEETGVRVIVQGMILIATLIVMLLLGAPLFRAGVGELMRGRLTIEFLFVTAIVGALIASLQSFLTGQGPIYFEVISILLVVYTFGKRVGARSRDNALTEARAWSESLRVCRRLNAQGDSQSISVTEIRRGDIVEVWPGELIPVDGVIIRGLGFTGEAAMTGEAAAAVRRPGDALLAGMASHDGTFQIQATAPGVERQIDRLLAAVDSARGAPSSLQGLADRLAAWLVPLIIVIAFTTFAVWTELTNWQVGLFNAMAVLLVACPCAVGLAVPIVTWTTLGNLAERGLLIKGGDVIERLARVDCVLFDKTGTLTEQQLTIADLVTLATGTERTRILGWLAAVQARCNHPVAKAFAQFMPETSPEPIDIIGLRTVPGAGVIADIRDERGEQHRLRVGRPEWLASERQTEIGDLLAELRIKAGLRIDVELDGRPEAIAILAERLRGSASETLLELEQLNLPVTILTGDTAERTVFVGLASRALTSLLPEEKRVAVASLMSRGARPLFVGDGVNDASALAESYVSVSLASGAQLANAAADGILYHGNLCEIPFALVLCRQAVASIRWNLSRAALYNLIGITLAALGLLHPVAAALLMMTSSLLVARSSVSLGTLGGFGRSKSPAFASQRPLALAICHGLALALQGPLVTELFSQAGSPARTTWAAFAVAGCCIGWLWYQWEGIPHWLDMTVGMLTFANLGMVVGWWFDLGFGPATHCSRCCGSIDSIGMWVGMLFLGNLAMAIGLRRPLPAECAAICQRAMFGGGNLGMIFGMLAAGQLATLQCFSAAGHLLAMSLGMAAGMLAGHFLTQLILRQGLSKIPVLEAKIAIDEITSL
jgi:heavy metal translocating P-type ATPase